MAFLLDFQGHLIINSFIKLQINGKTKGSL
jgi:hypothetical protein